MIWQVDEFREEYTAVADTMTPCLLIPGWSFDAGIFEWLLPGLAQYFRVSTARLQSLPVTVDSSQLVDGLARLIAQPVWIIGWSLGGNIAIELASRYPDKVLGLCLLATTPRFVADSDWQVGMPAASFDKFRQGLLQNAEKTLRKFDQLQTLGDAEEQKLRHALAQYRVQQDHLPANDLVHGLNLLAGFDQRAILSQIKVPALWCFGGMDALVNVDTVREIRLLCPLADIQIVQAATHALFLSHADHFFRSLLRIVNKNNLQCEKRKIAMTFGKAANNYDRSASLQHDVAGSMLQEVEKTAGIILDAGCGTGYCLPQLAGKAESVIGMDMAHGMLLHGQASFPAIPQYVEADLEYLPFADHSLAAIFSSLAVQWCTSASVFLAEWYRVLKPGGKAYIATLGENTLHELRDSWNSIDRHKHVNTFSSIENLREEVSLSSFTLEKMTSEKKVVSYDNVKTLMRDLKNIGAQTVMHNDKKGLMGKQHFLRFEQAYEAYRNGQGLLPATYEVIYMVLEKPL